MSGRDKHLYVVATFKDAVWGPPVQVSHEEILARPKDIPDSHEWAKFH